MSKPPIEQMLDAVQWEAVESTPSTTGLPHVTHRGILNIFGHELDCFVLSDGRRIFMEESIMRFFGIEK